ncbi:Maf family protein [Dermabacter vaginalis]|uniref:Nucleoside triphosphate pyrophosphatase n=1 Tax=Dermabacter vaginalis TaxID=1630135 RepID=A0ABX6A2V8_9MICO|nr:nucleoside triphosphate pyrophosphatase [Dermabacter vaginalis]QEU11509.1 septum formation inhibitor Maf [Dermabacter vaginalis]
MSGGLTGKGERADARPATVGTPPHEPLLLLASQSAGRKAVLSRAGIEFTALPADVDEDAVLASALDTSGQLAFEDRVLTLARAKAEASCAASEGGYVVLGGDSMLEFEGELVGKPRTAEAARERWHAMRGKKARLHSGHWLIDDRDPLDGGTGATFGETASTNVYFADLSDAEIDAYVETGEPLWVAGAFTIDGYGGPFIERIEGDHHAVIGLSLPLLRRMLREISLAVSDLWRPAPMS